MKCNKFYDAEYVFNHEGTPKCSCGGIVKPDVVLYEEGLDDDIVRNAIIAIQIFAKNIFIILQVRILLCAIGNLSSWTKFGCPLKSL